MSRRQIGEKERQERGGRASYSSSASRSLWCHLLWQLKQQAAWSGNLQDSVCNAILLSLVFVCFSCDFDVMSHFRFHRRRGLVGLHDFFDGVACIHGVCLKVRSSLESPSDVMHVRLLGWWFHIHFISLLFLFLSACLKFLFECWRWEQRQIEFALSG